MRRHLLSSILVGLFALVLTTACEPTVEPGNFEPGQTDFVSADPNGGAGAYNSRGTDDATAGAAEGAPDADGAGATERTVEEADIVRIDGHLLYVLNQYRGLQIIDLTNRDDPTLIGMAPIYGYPVEMYVRNDRAYIVVSNYYDYQVVDDVDSDVAIAPFRGSQIRVVDVSDSTNPLVLGGYDIPGDITDTRIVGDILYAVSSRYPWYYGYQTQDTVDGTFVTSIDVSAPSAIEVVDEVSFARNGWNHHVNVTANAIHLASSGWENDGYRSRLRYIDISDPEGDIVLGGEVQVQGWIRDRWMLDEYDGVLRVVTAPDWRGTAPKLYTFATTGATYTRLATMNIVIPRPESLTAVRFDGDKGYVVTYERVDPLFTLDLSDPKKPLQVGELEMPGWLDHIAPRGDRLVALGHDDGTGTWRLAVSLFDVSDLANPTMLDRVTFGENWGWIPDERDNFDKVFKVLDDVNLVMVPFHSYGFDEETGYWNHAGGVQLVDFFRDDLVKRGLIDHPGYVKRAMTYEDRILTVSNEAMQTVDATDRDAPAVTGEVELARNVVDFVKMGNHAVQLVGDWYRGDTRLVVLEQGEYDLGEPIAEVQVTAPYGRMFVNGDFIYLVSQDWRNGNTQIRVVDLSDPANPVVTGSVDLPQPVSYWYGYWGWYGGDELVQVGGDKLVFHTYRFWYRAYDCWNCGPNGTKDYDELFVVDLSNPDAPTLASTIELKTEDWVWGLRAQGNILYFTHYEHAGQDRSGRAMSRYFLDRIDLSDPANPGHYPKVNVPGTVVDLSDDGRIVYTQDQQWKSNGDSWEMTYAFNALSVHRTAAVLRDRIELDGYVNRVIREGNAAFFTKNNWWYDTDGTYHYDSRLAAIDLSDVDNLRVVGDMATPGNYGWLRDVQGGRAFVDLGWQGGLLVYDVTDLDNIDLEGFHRHQGWISSIRVVGDTAFVARGYYGVEALPLGDPNY